jgi:multidrug efflux pump
MDGIVGRLLREFSLTLTFAIVVSTVVSLTVTPMICAHFIKAPTSDATWFDRLVEGSLSRIVAFYAWTLRVVLGFPFLTLLVFFATIALTVTLYIKTPKGYFPTDDSGFVIGSTRHRADISFQAMLELQQQLADIVMADPAVAGIGSSLGGGGGPGGGGSNRGTMFISLKPPESAAMSTQQVIDRLRRNLYRVAGIRLFMFAAQDIRTGGRQSDSDYQYTLSSTDLDLLQKWAPDRRQAHGDGVEGITDVSSDRDPGGCN